MDHMGEYKGAKYDMKLGVHEFTSFIVLINNRPRLSYFIENISWP